MPCSTQKMTIISCSLASCPLGSHAPCVRVEIVDGHKANEDTTAWLGSDASVAGFFFLEGPGLGNT